MSLLHHGFIAPCAFNIFNIFRHLSRFSRSSKTFSSIEIYWAYFNLFFILLTFAYLRTGFTSQEVHRSQCSLAELSSGPLSWRRFFFKHQVMFISFPFMPRLKSSFGPCCLECEDGRAAGIRCEPGSFAVKTSQTGGNYCPHHGQQSRKVIVLLMHTCAHRM